MTAYPATFEQDGKYIMVKFPDIPEAMTQGVDMNEAKRAALEVLELSLEDRKHIPTPTSLEVVKTKYPDKEVIMIGK